MGIRKGQISLEKEGCHRHHLSHIIYMTLQSFHPDQFGKEAPQSTKFLISCLFLGGGGYIPCFGSCSYWSDLWMGELYCLDFALFD